MFLTKIIWDYKREISYFTTITILHVLVAIYSTCEMEKSQQMFNLMLLVIGVLGLGFWYITPKQWQVPYMGLKISKRCVYEMGLGVLLACVYYMFAIALPAMLNIIRIETNPNGYQFSYSQWKPLWAGTLISTFVLGIFFINKVFGEELGFRGFLFGTIYKRTNIITGIISNAVFFSLWHIPYLIAFKKTDSSSLFLNVLWLGIGCVPVCLLFAKTNNLYAISLYHALVNLKEMIILTAKINSGLNKYTMFVYHVQHPKYFMTCQTVALLGQVLFALWLWRKMPSRA